MTETLTPYAPDRAALFMRGAPPAERLHRAREEFQLLRIIAENISLLLLEGGVADRKQLSAELDGSITRLGAILAGRP